MGFHLWAAPITPFPGEHTWHIVLDQKRTSPAVPQLGDAQVIRSHRGKDPCMEGAPTMCQGLGQVLSVWDPSSS